MITLSIVAAGIIALAAALLARPSPEPRAADQRGITLQTLIVTAVLVLMAVAAGVVIVAITNTQRENLQAANPTTGDSKCEPWEIYDISAAAAGRGGENLGVDSSGIGCIRVCYVKIYSTAVIADGNAIDLVDKDTPANTNLEATLEFSRSNISDSNATGTRKKEFPVMGDLQIDIDSSSTGQTSVDIEEIDGVNIDPANANFEIRVSASQKYCELINTSTGNDAEEFRSMGEPAEA